MSDMLSQPVKDIYFLANRLLCKPNALLTRMRYARPEHREGLYLHLGSGANYLPGLVNCEGNFLRRKDVWLDLRSRLPFADRSAYFVYCSHTLEHLYPDEALVLLRDICRILTPEGVARIAVPSVEFALQIVQGKANSTWPREFTDRWGQAINYLFCDGQHRYAYSFGILEDFARRAGFRTVLNYSANHGVSPKTYGQVSVGDEPEGSLVVELSIR
jgi:predicted SAM-dependent methyltransferase